MKHCLLTTLITILSLISIVGAEQTTFLLDRRGFKSQPTTACSSVFKGRELIFSTCSSVGFKTSVKQKISSESYDEFIYFFKLEKEASFFLRDKYLFLTTYLKDGKVLAIAPFRSIGKGDLISFNPKQGVNLNSQLESLSHERNTLLLELSKKKEDLELRLAEDIKAAQSSSEFQKIIQQISLKRNLDFHQNEVSLAEERNRKLELDQRNFKSGPLKASLTTMLRATIEGNLKK